MAGADYVLVTGAGGFIAKHIVRELLEKGYRVRGTVRTAARAAEVRAAVDDVLARPDDLDFVETDLLTDAGWDGAMEGIAGVFHTASPFPSAVPRDEDDLIRPAVEGTRRVLAAAEQAGISRIVLTSSVAAVMGGRPGVTRFTADDWTDVAGEGVSAYFRSKTLAERAAWAYVAQSGQAMTAINPSLVVGPPLDRHFGTSLDIIALLLRGTFPLLPRIQSSMVDVRDVARLHRIAFETDGTIGERLIVSAGDPWVSDVAKMLGAAFPGRRIPSREGPDWLMRTIALFSGAVRQFVSELGEDRTADTSRAEALLGGYIPLETALAETGRALIALGVVR